MNLPLPNKAELGISSLKIHNKYGLSNELQWPESPFSVNGLLSPYFNTVRLSARKIGNSDSSYRAQVLQNNVNTGAVK